ncbi:MAG: hypothetical protein R2713_20790 [Ilumatobacteraceae bacterium]
MKEAKELNPLLEEKFFVGALYDEDEGSGRPVRRHPRTRSAPATVAPRCTRTWVNGLTQRQDGVGRAHLRPVDG